MTDKTVVEEPTTTEAPKTKKDLKPIVKKALIWGGVALGAVAIFLLVKPRQDEDEQDYLIVEETTAPDGTTTTTTIAPIND